MNGRHWLRSFQSQYLKHAANREAFMLLDPRPAILEATVRLTHGHNHMSYSYNQPLSQSQSQTQSQGTGVGMSKLKGGGLYGEKLKVRYLGTKDICVTNYNSSTDASTAEKVIDIKTDKGEIEKERNNKITCNNQSFSGFVTLACKSTRDDRRGVHGKCFLVEEVRESTQFNIYT